MCGINGIIRFDGCGIERSSVERMMARQKHRGPDDEGIFIEKNVGLGFVRLSIIDLSIAGHQPMLSIDERYVLIFNGEIFNFIELREELISKGYSFKTKADSEVLLYSFIEWGKTCLDHFNGMWAFVIYDRFEKIIFAARDRYGIKPFYYYADESSFIFASEIPPILSVLENKPVPEYQVIFDYLTFNRTDQTEATFFHGIKKLQHGHYLSLKTFRSYKKEATGDILPVKWYDLRSNLKSPFLSTEEFREMFVSSVKLRLRSDVPIGVCLSGGLDSSAIVSVLLKDFQVNDLNTFSAVYEKGHYGDESEFIDEYRMSIENMKFTTPTASTLIEDIPKFIRLHGEPLPSTSPYAQYKVMELAAGNVTVTLDGQGADEMLAGYHYFFGFYFKELLASFKWLSLIKEAAKYLINHKSVYGIKTFGYFLLPAQLKNRSRVSEKGYLNNDFVDSYSLNNTITKGLYSSRNLNEALIDHFKYKLEHLLKWEDRNSMHFSIEARVPFLDHRLVEKTLSLPSEKIIHQGMTKYFFREAMKGTLPEKIRSRKDKIGFATPQAEWFRDERFKKYFNELLSSASFASRGIINEKKAQTLYNDHINRKTDISKELWKWINLELWYRQYID